jgi:hypothetical protein
MRNGFPSNIYIFPKGLGFPIISRKISPRDLEEFINFYSTSDAPSYKLVCKPH